MSFKYLNAQGNNGVRATTTIDNLGILSGYPAILLVRGDVAYPEPNPYIDVVGIQATGNGRAPGVVGYTFNGGGVGVAGINQVAPVGVGIGPPTRMIPSIDPLFKQFAGVYGYCEVGFGVVGEGSNASNPSSQAQSPTTAGTGVVGQGGKSAPATEATLEGLPPIINPALPGGAGVVGLGGSASMPTADVINGAGVVGLGSPLGNGYSPGRGGVFGSSGYAAQLRLIPGPPPNEQPLLPSIGEVGDLYITSNTEIVDGRPAGGIPIMFMCIRPGVATTPATWVPFLIGPPQNGGTAPSFPGIGLTA